MRGCCYKKLAIREMESNFYCHIYKINSLLADCQFFIAAYFLHHHINLNNFGFHIPNCFANLKHGIRNMNLTHINTANRSFFQRPC